MTVIKVSVLSAHDKGSHAEVHVKVRKVLHSGRTALSLGTISVYPLSWTSRGCTCPLLNPGKMHLLFILFGGKRAFFAIRWNFFLASTWHWGVEVESVESDFLSPPGVDYLLAGPEEAGTGRLLVTMQSVVVPWTPRLGLLLSEGLQNGCQWRVWAWPGKRPPAPLASSLAAFCLLTDLLSWLILPEWKIHNEKSDSDIFNAVNFLFDQWVGFFFVFKGDFFF